MLSTEETTQTTHQAQSNEFLGALVHSLVDVVLDASDEESDVEHELLQAAVADDDGMASLPFGSCGTNRCIESRTSPFLRS